MNIGIDVAKDSLEWAEGPDAPVQRLPNDLRSIRRLVRRFASLKPERIVLESTGGYERVSVRHGTVERRDFLQMALGTHTGHTGSTGK